ncbi:hypothetical protein THASP1DRAFT_27154 [Thamnocephalis sphaerospora]|uniref:Uncharacterized protein n=1 Tax=Thamnocephalis sphaerospora TaxID=78915 RepID=A0A4P9XXF0_9FUNG|nr:hypothetical protein THASP1DRAFT_27154 [Thamnocephalis sphaerospora]|eukprot:RKP11055.1 hypothetical protein THASP1DRAFT_27154 [Thamnocephalis sphaerospora]
MEPPPRQPTRNMLPPLPETPPEDTDVLLHLNESMEQVRRTLQSELSKRQAQVAALQRERRASGTAQRARVLEMRQVLDRALELQRRKQVLEQQQEQIARATDELAERINTAHMEQEEMRQEQEYAKLLNKQLRQERREHVRQRKREVREMREYSAVVEDRIRELVNQCWELEQRLK